MLDWNKVRFESRCKICKLYRTHKELFEEIHNMVLHTGFSKARALQYANYKIVELNEKQQANLHFFTPQNFGYHFSKHLPIDIATALRLRKSYIQAVYPRDEEAEMVLQKHFDDVVDAKISDYERLSSWVDQFERRMRELDNSLNETGLTWKHSQDYSSMMRDMHRMIEGLIKLKQSDKMMSVVVTEVLYKYTVGSLRSIISIIEQVQEEISLYNKDLSGKIGSKLRSSIVSGMEDNAKDVVEAVQKQFRLKL